MTCTVLHLPPGFPEAPCDLCRVWVLAVTLEPAPDYVALANEKMICGDCFDALEREANEEAAIAEANGRMTEEEMGVV